MRKTSQTGLSVLLLAALACSPRVSTAAIFVDDDSEASETSSYKLADNGVEMRGLRRAGIGLIGGGIAGIAGLNLEINFTDQTGISGGFGLSSEFQSFYMGMKHVFGGRWFLPYVSGNYARWFSTCDRGPVSESTPGFLAERFLRDHEKATGRFSKNLLAGALGIQYLQLKGDWAGASVYLEGLLVIDADDFLVAPTAGLGGMYYF